MSISVFLFGIKKLDFLILFVIILWVLTFIATPIVGGMMGEMALQRMIALAVLMQVMAVVVILFRYTGLKRTAAIVIPILLLAWSAEFIGSRTGFPFGVYSYTEVLQPQLGNVPILIPLAWLMMLPPSWAAASLIADRFSKFSYLSDKIVRALVAALAFTAWDLYLDPQMVAWNFWRWGTPGFYFGIPLLNFAGWLLVSFIVAILFQPDQLPITPLMVIYSLTWLLQFIGQLFFWSLPGPAVFGFLAMGGVVLLVFWRNKRQKNDAIWN